MGKALEEFKDLCMILRTIRTYVNCRENTVILKSWQSQETSVDHDQILAGNPKILPDPQEPMRQYIFGKWNHRPKRDMHKDWVKNTILS